MTKNHRLIRIFVITLMLGCGGFASAATKHHARHKVIHQAGWAGAGFAAGHFVGPPGSAAVGATRYRRDLKAGGRRRTHAMVKIGGPIAAGAIAGPPGVVGYTAVEHRNWIKRHIFHRKPHPSRQRRQ